jgi:hypothetical protein
MYVKWVEYTPSTLYNHFFLIKYIKGNIMNTTFIKKIAVVMLMISLSSVALASDFCNGFAQGYQTGYKQARSTNLNPLIPLCPLQPLKGFGDPQSDFEHGYTIGYKKGLVSGK